MPAYADVSEPGYSRYNKSQSRCLNIICAIRRLPWLGRVRSGRSVERQYFFNFALQVAPCAQKSNQVLVQPHGTRVICNMTSSRRLGIKRGIAPSVLPPSLLRFTRFPRSHPHNHLSKFLVITTIPITMPKDNHGNSYGYKSSGTNSGGNHHCSRDYGSSASNSNSYHYSNKNGSYYYSNSDGSKYYNPGSSGAGKTTYTPADSASASGQSSGSEKSK